MASTRRCKSAKLQAPKSRGNPSSKHQLAPLVVGPRAASQSARTVDWLDAGAEMPAPPLPGAKQPVSDFGGSLPVAQPGDARSGPVVPAIIAGLADAARLAAGGGGKLCGRATLPWHGLQSGGLDLAGRNQRLRSQCGGLLRAAQPAHAIVGQSARRGRLAGTERGALAAAAGPLRPSPAPTLPRQGQPPPECWMARSPKTPASKMLLAPSACPAGASMASNPCPPAPTRSPPRAPP